jgi:hypothetical protein
VGAVACGIGKTTDAPFTQASLFGDWPGEDMLAAVVANGEAACRGNRECS